LEFVCDFVFEIWNLFEICILDFGFCNCTRAMTSSPTSSPARLIVCESSGSWSAALRIELAEASVRVWECRSLREAWDALTQTPAAFLVAEAARENLDTLLRRMDWFSRDFPHARVAIVAA
jgi:hypothetical protein